MALVATIALGWYTRIVDGDLAAVIARHPGCVLAGVPATYRQLGHEIRGISASPRLCLTAGAPCTPQTRAVVDELFGVRLLDCYGSTETSGKIAVQLPGQTGQTGQTGQAGA